MIYVAQTMQSRERTLMRTAPVAAPDHRRPLSGTRLLGGNPLDDPSMLDEQFDELGCEVSVLLKIANQA
jgi:hypothetical protein